MALEWPDLEKEQKILAAKKKKPGFIVSDSDDGAKRRRGRKESGLLFQVEVSIVRFVLDSFLW